MEYFDLNYIVRNITVSTYLINTTFSINCRQLKSTRNVQLFQNPNTFVKRYFCQEIEKFYFD